MNLGFFSNFHINLLIEAGNKNLPPSVDLVLLLWTSGQDSSRMSPQGGVSDVSS